MVANELKTGFASTAVCGVPIGACLLALAACQATPEETCPYTEEVPSTSAGCFLQEGSRLLVVEQRDGRWNFPAGGAQGGESPRCTAWRETLEETGVKPEVGEHLATMPNGFQLFHCSVAVGAELNPSDALEIKRAFWVEGTAIHETNWRFPEQVRSIRGWLGTP